MDTKPFRIPNISMKLDIYLLYRYPTFVSTIYPTFLPPGEGTNRVECGVQRSIIRQADHRQHDVCW